MAHPMDLSPEILEIRDERIDGPVAAELIESLQAEYIARYGSPDTSPIDVSAFEPPRGRFLVGWIGPTPVASGGLRNFEHADAEDGSRTLEIKRMFVRAGWRGRGLSRQMLGALEAAAAEMGATTVVLETGQRQPEAIALYQSSGYRQREPFGFYADAPLSIFLTKKLGAPPPTT